MIIDLKDCFEHIPTLASWDYGQWGFRRPHIQLMDTINFYEKACDDPDSHIPVLIDEARNIPMGMCSLLTNDPFAPVKEGTNFYIISLYIQERYRNQGLAKSLIRYAENYGLSKGRNIISCNTRNAEKLFLDSGWVTKEVLFDKTLEKPLNFMCKQLNHN